MMVEFLEITTPSSSANQSKIQLNCIAKANIGNDGLLAYESRDYPSSSCDECMCSMVRMNISTTVVCREDISSCKMIYSHPSLLMSYVKIDLKSRVCYRSFN